MKLRMLSILHQEKGTALIIAIGMLAVLSILGTVVLTASTRDLGLSGGFLPARQTFYTADRAVEYAMNPELLLTLEAKDDSIDLKTATAQFDNEISLTKTHGEIIESFGIGILNSGRITRSDDVPGTLLNTRYRPAPEGAGTVSNAAFFHIEVTATANNAREAHIDVMAIAEKITAPPWGGGGGSM